MSKKIFPRQDEPPHQNRFDDADDVPGHITYAYIKGARIARNDQFYHLKPGQKLEIDVLFLIMNAAARTGSLPIAGSQDYVGLSADTEVAINALANKFPSFFPDK